MSAPADANRNGKSTKEAANASAAELNRENLRRLSEATAEQSRKADEDGADAGKGKSAGSSRPNAPTGELPSMDSSSVDVDIAEQSREFLLQRVAALERQLRIRNSDCSRLLQERHALFPLRQKCESQAEMIEALQDKVALLETQRVSALETIERLRKQIQNQTHQDRVKGFQQRVGSEDFSPKPSEHVVSLPVNQQTPSPSPSALPGGVGSRVRVMSVTSDATASKPQQQQQQQRRMAPGGTVVATSAGPQILYDSSDISSVGFQKNAKLPYDFLGGPAAQQQYYRSVRQPQEQQQPSSEGNASGNGAGAFEEGESGEVNRLMAMAREEAEMAVKYAEVEAREEQELRARLAALKKR